MILSTSPIHIINDLLQGELSATETYQQALSQVGGVSGADELRQIHREHREAASRLRLFVRELDGKPSQSSQTWGLFAKAIEGGAKLLGNNAALMALKVGEERGASTYEEALTNEHLPAEFVEFVRGTLLPQTRAHVDILNQILQSFP